MSWTVYEVSTGRIVSVLDMALSDVRLNVLPGQQALAGAFDPGAWYVRDDQPVPIPQRPGPDYLWDHRTAAWIDPRTPDDLTAELRARRERAGLTRLEFLFRARDVGLLSREGTQQASEGLIPTEYAETVALMPAALLDDLRIAWRVAARIERTSPFIAAIAEARGITPEALDTLFGV